MRLPAAGETTILIFAVFFSFYWTNQTYLSKFNWQLVSLLILLFIFHSRRTKKRQNNDPVQIYQNIINITIVTIITVVLILSTGGAGSMLFWLLNFLLFFAAVFSRAGAGIALSLALVLGFLLNEPQLTTHQLLNLISLLLMSPLASFFSSQYRRVITAQAEIETLSNQAKEEETDALLWLSLNFKNKMEQAIDLLSQVKSNLSLVPYHQRDKFNQLYQDLKELFISGRELEKKIDELSD